MNRVSLNLVNKFNHGYVMCRRHQHSRRFLTIPIFYVNADPHIGHLFTALLGDVTYRWEALKATSENILKKDIEKQQIFTAGTDEHGIKIENAAQRANRLPIEHCDLYAKRFRELFQHFSISNTHFVRTTEEKHKCVVQDIWKRLSEEGCIQKNLYKGWYSTVDECFYKELDTQLSNNKTRISSETGNTVEYVEEENYMFTMGKFRDSVREWLLKSDVIHPRNYLPQALQHLKDNDDGLLSISRDAKRLKWGISVPGDDSQIIYVWLDALANYLTAVGYPDVKSADFVWPPDVQIIGKDILKFHVVYWPAFLMALRLPLPRKIFVHGHWLVDKAKMSKSTGNVVDPFEIAKILTVDGMRYFMLKQDVSHGDCNFTLLKAMRVVNSDLVNNLGNLIQRSAVKRMNPQQLYPAFDVEVMEHDLKGTGEKLVRELKLLRERVGNYYESQMFYKGIEAINETLKHANAFFQHHEPWNMSRGPDLSTILFLVYEACRISSVLLQPIIPNYSTSILSRFGLAPDEMHLDTSQFAGGPSIKIYRRPLGAEKDPILRRIDFDKVENIVKRVVKV